MIKCRPMHALVQGPLGSVRLKSAAAANVPAMPRASCFPTSRLWWYHSSPSSQYSRALRQPKAGMRSNSDRNARDSSSSWSARLKKSHSVRDIKYLIEQHKAGRSGGDLDPAAVLFAVGVLEALARVHCAALTPAGSDATNQVCWPQGFSILFHPCS